MPQITKKNYFVKYIYNDGVVQYGYHFNMFWTKKSNLYFVSKSAAYNDKTKYNHSKLKIFIMNILHYT